jgi:hypothetical protein
MYDQVKEVRLESGEARPAVLQALISSKNPGNSTVSGVFPCEKF